MRFFYLGSHYPIALFIICINLFCNSQAFAIQDSMVIKAENLIRQGQFNAAYQLLEPFENARAGDIDFDYVLGIAAVESKHASRGAFALERVLALNPDHKDARAEMAKAHFMLGEKEAAKAEFNAVLQQGVDLQVIQAFVPLSEMFGYVTRLRSLSQGRASYTMKFARYEPVYQSVTSSY